MKQNALYLSRLVPGVSGSGVVMRAGLVLEALAADFNVHLLVIPVRGETALPQPSPEIARWCTAFSVLPLAGTPDPAFDAGTYTKPAEFRYATPQNVQAAANAFPGVEFQIVHVFRLFLAPFAEPYLEAAPSRRPVCCIDLDDYQSKSRGRLAQLCQSRGRMDDAARERGQSARFAEAENLYLPRFDRVYVAGQQDADAISEHYQIDNVTVLPNAIRLPSDPPDRRGDGLMTLLFLGALDYYPNVDAALYFCEHILPELRHRSGRQFRVILAGARPAVEVRQLERHPEVTVLADVQDVGDCYAEADIVIAPLRAGGGTRIKILECAAYRRPIVSTSLGAESLTVTNGQHLLIADDPREFAQRCAELMNNAELRAELSEKAFQWLRSQHTLENVREALRRPHQRPR